MLLAIVVFFLGVILAASLVTIIGLGIGLSKARYHASTSSPTGTPTVSNETCSTPGCVELSSLILSKLDASVNPCDDFYAFACNRFINNSIIPYGESSFVVVVIVMMYKINFYFPFCPTTCSHYTITSCPKLFSMTLI